MCTFTHIHTPKDAQCIGIRDPPSSWPSAFAALHARDSESPSDKTQKISRAEKGRYRDYRLVACDIVGFSDGYFGA